MKFFRDMLIVGVVATLLALYLFSSGHGTVLFPPYDGSPFYRENHGEYTMKSFVGPWCPWNAMGHPEPPSVIHPSRLLEMALPPLVYHEIDYAVCVGTLAAAGYYMMMCFGIGRLGCVAGGVALAFGGYSFSLISAGHRGVFQMMPYSVWMLGLVYRGVERKSIYHFAMAGLCCAFAFVAQPDVAILFCLLAAGLGAFAWSKFHPGYLCMVKGVAAGAVVFCLLAASSIKYGLRETLPGREAAMGHNASMRWEFATNWSLPPEDVLEFVWPCVYGIESNHPTKPYWGRMGRSAEWEKTGRGLKNWRQHTVYLGAIQVVLALVCVAVFRKTRTVWFWMVVGVVSILLALGRYGPLYEVFYGLPLMNKLRCPAKFLHITNVAVCVLFSMFMGDKRWAGRRSVAVWVVILVVTGDMMRVGYKYIHVGSVAPWYAPNAVVAAFVRDHPHERVWFDDGVVSWRNPAYGNPASKMLTIVQPEINDAGLAEDYRTYFTAIGKNPGRMCALTSTTHVFRHGELLPMAKAMPRCSVYHSWRHLPEEEILRLLPLPEWNFGQTALVDFSTFQGVGHRPPTLPDKVEYGQNRVRVIVHVEDPGILVLNDRYDTDWKVSVNGRDATMFRANYLMRGVMIGPGKHTVVFTYRPYLVTFVLGLFGLLGCGVWTVCEFRRGRQRCAA